MDFSVENINMGVESDSHNKVIRKKFNLMIKSISNEFFYRGRNESFHKLKCARIAKGNEAGIEGEIHNTIDKFYGESLFQNSF